MRFAARFCLATCVALSLSATAQAQTWPQKSVRIIVPYGPGSSPDTLVRLINERLSARLGQPFIVENKPGAGGNTGTEYVAKAEPDDHTFLMSVNAPLVYNTILFKNLRYDPFRELMPVSLAVTSPNVCAASASMGVDSVKGWLDAMRANPGKYNFASSGSGSVSHLAVELLKARTNSFAVHIPYTSSSQAILGMLQGDVNFACLPGSAVMPQVKAGKLKVLAVTSAERSPLLPDVPTLKESGVPDIQAAPWYAYMAPQGTSPAVVDRMSQEVAAIMKEPEVIEKLKAQYFDVIGSSPEALGVFMGEERDRWQPVIERAGLKPN
jgi:tripartite-type tricarboxylate transporter receptor subunit TctC